MKDLRCFFTVEGRGPFPFDMLRYDQCWPYYGEDAAKLDHHYEDERRRVVLESYSKNGPTKARWASFTWRVVEVGMPNTDSRVVEIPRITPSSPKVEIIGDPGTEWTLLAAKNAVEAIQKWEA